MLFLDDCMVRADNRTAATVVTQFGKHEDFVWTDEKGVILTGLGTFSAMIAELFIDTWD
jgi:hypothetical protein